MLPNSKADYPKWSVAAQQYHSNNRLSEMSAMRIMKYSSFSRSTNYQGNNTFDYILSDYSSQY